MSTTINVNIKSSSDKKFVIAIETDKTVLDLKNTIAEHTEVPAERQRLIYSGRVLKDHDTLTDCKIADGNTIHMVKGSQPGASKRMVV
jgi:ubiquilin